MENNYAVGFSVPLSTDDFKVTIACFRFCLQPNKFILERSVSGIEGVPHYIGPNLMVSKQALLVVSVTR